MYELKYILLPKSSPYILLLLNKQKCLTHTYTIYDHSETIKSASLTVEKAWKVHSMS